MNSLFSVELPASNKTPTQLQKNNSEEERQYINRMTVKSREKSQQNFNRLRD